MRRGISGQARCPKSWTRRQNAAGALQQYADADARRAPARQKELDAISNRLSDLYDDCLHGMDAELGRFLGGLRESGMLTNTWVVITADHGEHFGEHGHFGHGSSLYNAMTHVPLILIPPSSTRMKLASTDPPGCAAVTSACRYHSATCRKRSPRCWSLTRENPFPGRSLARYWSDKPPGAAEPGTIPARRPTPAGRELSNRECDQDRFADRR